MQTKYCKVEDTFFMQREHIDIIVVIVHHERSKVTHFLQGSAWYLQTTYRRLQLDRVYNVPHHRTLIDDLLYSKVSRAPPPQHPTPQTIILESAVMLVLSTAGSKGFVHTVSEKKSTWRASAHCVRGIHHCDREKLTKNISLQGSFFFSMSNAPCRMS